MSQNSRCVNVGDVVANSNNWKKTIPTCTRNQVFVYVYLEHCLIDIDNMQLGCVLLSLLH